MVSLHEGLTELSRDFRMLRREVTLFGRIGIQIVQCSVIGFGFVDELKGPPARGAVDGENARGHDGLVGDPAAGLAVLSSLKKIAVLFALKKARQIETIGVFERRLGRHGENRRNEVDERHRRIDSLTRRDGGSAHDQGNP